ASARSATSSLSLHDALPIYEPRQLARLLSTVAVPYVIFEGIHAGIRMAMGSEVNLNLWEPAWTLWFLLALFFWRLLTPLLRALRHPLLISIGVSLLAPLDGHLDETLSWGRVLSFLPFFTLGLIATPEHIQRLRDFRFKILGAVLLAAGLALSFLMHDQFSATLLFMREGYEDVGLTGESDVLVALAHEQQRGAELIVREGYEDVGLTGVQGLLVRAV